MQGRSSALRTAQARGVEGLVDSDSDYDRERKLMEQDENERLERHLPKSVREKLRNDPYERIEDE